MSSPTCNPPTATPPPAQASQWLPWTALPPLVGVARRTVDLTKLYPPELRANYVARPHLISLLNSDPGRKLTLISAPAGYGKSTLAAQWLAQLRMPRAWVTFEAGDNNPRTFFGLIVAALHTIEPGLVSGTEAILAGYGAVPADAIVHRLLADLAATTHPFVLVLDDLHTIESPELLRAMDLMLHQAPRPMRVVLISRTEPALQVARFRANGELREIRWQDLVLTPQEAHQFCQDSLGVDLTPEEAATLVERTEGWLAGVQLVCVALRGRSREQLRQSVDGDDGNAHFADRYLSEDILRRQPDDIQAFLLRTSILNRFTADLCDAVAEIRDSEDLIRRCGRDNLFVIPLDGVGAWHRYHQLFADVLHDRLARTVAAEEIDGLHRRASHWFEQRELYADAVRHAVAGHDWERAIRLLEDRCTELFEWDHVATLRDWLQGLPPTIFERSPRLAFWLAWALGRTGRWSEGVEPLRLAEAAWMETDDRPDKGSFMLLDACRALYGFDNLRAINGAHRALDLLPEDRSAERIFALATLGIAYIYHGEPGRAEEAFASLRSLAASTGKPWFQLFEMAHSAGIMIQCGRLLDATDLCQRVIRAAGDSPIEIWVQAALYHLGSIELEWGQLADAKEYLERADGLAEMTGAIQWRGRILVGLARIALANGELEVAFDRLERAIGFATQLGNEQELRNIRAWQARFWLASHQIDLVRRWALGMGLDPSRPPEYERQVESLTYVRLLTNEGRPDLALRILEPIWDQAEAAGRDGDLVEILVLTALAHKARGNTAAASRSLHHALELASPSGFVRVFVDEGEDLAILLRREDFRGDLRAYTERLLAAVDGNGTPERSDPLGPPDPLSEREIEVLRLVSAGLPNREIGLRLFIAEKTVKKHMHNILHKLDATNRTHAVDRARHLGLT
jgi:LuxR family maltose regulon positive regulatory protein